MRRSGDVQQLIHIHCLVGPTHHYGGLADGNVASQRHKGSVSNPKQAALQSLDKINNKGAARRRYCADYISTARAAQPTFFT